MHWKQKQKPQTVRVSLLCATIAILYPSEPPEDLPATQPNRSGIILSNIHKEIEFYSCGFYFFLLWWFFSGLGPETDGKLHSSVSDSLLTFFSHFHLEPLSQCLNGQLFYQKGNWQQGGLFWSVARWPDNTLWCSAVMSPHHSGKAKGIWSYNLCVWDSLSPVGKNGCAYFRVRCLFIEFGLLDFGKHGFKNKVEKKWHSVFDNWNSNRGHKVKAENAILGSCSFLLARLIISDLGVRGRTFSLMTWL